MYNELYFIKEKHIILKAALIFNFVKPCFSTIIGMKQLVLGYEYEFARYCKMWQVNVYTFMEVLSMEDYKENIPGYRERLR